jgi:hypothetical protein
MAKKLSVEQRLKAVEEVVFSEGHSIDEAVNAYAFIGQQFAATLGDFAHDMSTIYQHLMTNLGVVHQLYGGEVPDENEDVSSIDSTETAPDFFEKSDPDQPHLTVIQGGGETPSTTDSA